MGRVITKPSRTPFAVESLKTLEEPRIRPAPLTSPCGACPVRHLTVCAVLDPEELHELTTIVSNVELTPGQPLFDECEPAKHVFNVTAGAMKIYKLLPDGRRQITGFLFPGDFLGLAITEVYAYSAEAVTHSTLCRFPRRKLEGLLARYPKMESRLLGMASNELVIAQEQMLLLGRKTAREKLASFLLMLSKRQVQRGGGGDPVTVPITRADIGDYLGLTTETVSRTFTQLKRRGVITILSGGRIEMADRQALEDIAEGY
jgi:CRP/FNR family transcriptional regulator